jgi:hypothetical protein
MATVFPFTLGGFAPTKVSTKPAPGGLGAVPTQKTLPAGQVVPPGSAYLGVNLATGQPQTQYVPYPKPTPEELRAERMAGLEEAMAREALQQARLATSQAYTGGGTAGVPTTTRTSLSALSEASGPTPSLSEIKRAMEFLQPQAPMPPGLPAQVPAPTPADWGPALAAAYAAAKDNIANETAAARQAGRANLTARGVSGTGLEQRFERDLTSRALGLLGQVARDLAQQQMATQNQFAQLGYQGGIQQRAQDLSALMSQYQAQLGLLPNPVAYIGPLAALRQAGGMLW